MHDTFSQDYADDASVEATLQDPRSGRVIIYCWNVAPELVSGALDKGCRGYVDEGATAEELVLAIERVAAGEIVRPRDGDTTGPDLDSGPQDDMPGSIDSDGSAGSDYPGQGAGLSVREAEMIALITEGLTNENIAQRCYLSPNTVKSYIRTAYQKVGVTRRSEAVRWGMENGMLRPGQHGASG
ncbi:DNA-binding response regulator [Ornithinimicrobium sp. Y1694]|uniref:response regulator transcription factor n=1 Tax=Ornithinimicrobium sp. Y1694 TaxID=3418590 RepID=UPI003CF6B585